MSNTPVDPTAFNNVMLDIETLGIETGCVVMQIAAVPFRLEDPAFGIGTPDEWKLNATLTPWVYYLNTSEQIEDGFKIDGKTLNFWTKTDHVMLFANLIALGNKNKNEDMLKTMQMDMNSLGERKNVIFWSRGMDFDFPILDRLFRHYIKETGEITPWFYRNKCDVRTYIRAAFGNEMPHRQYYFGSSHDAVVDCYNQIQDVQKAWTKLNENHT